MSTTTQRHPQHSKDTVLKFHAKAKQASESEGLAQGPYVAARAGIEPTTLQTIGVNSTELPRITWIWNIERWSVLDTRVANGGAFSGFDPHRFIRPTILSNHYLSWV